MGTSACAVCAYFLQLRLRRLERQTAAVVAAPGGGLVAAAPRGPARPHPTWPPPPAAGARQTDRSTDWSTRDSPACSCPCLGVRGHREIPHSLAQAFTVVRQRPSALGSSLGSWRMEYVVRRPGRGQGASARSRDQQEQLALLQLRQLMCHWLLHVFATLVGEACVPVDCEGKLLDG